jgi:rubrerythrin
MDIGKSLRMALENEQKGMKMYEGFAKKAKNEITKRTFRFLADEEVKHIDSIKEFAKTGKMKVKLRPITEVKVKTIFKTSVSHFSKKVKTGTMDIEAHKLGMELEEKSYDLYEKMAKAAKDRKSKEFFVFLMKEESLHYDLIRNAFDFISDPESWYAGEEKRMMEG